LYLQCSPPLIARRTKVCISSGESAEGLNAWAASRIGSTALAAAMEGGLYTITRAGSISASEDEAVDGDWRIAIAAGRF